MVRNTNFLIYVLGLSLLSSCSNYRSKEYLKTVIKNLETIETANYTEIAEIWQHSDTTASAIYVNKAKEYKFPLDTTIGSKYVLLDKVDTTKLIYGYDGLISAVAYNEDEVIVIDDFSTRPFPFRLTTPSFFNYTKSIIKYATETTDSINLKIEDKKKFVYLNLDIYEENQIEFFGKAFKMPISPYSFDNNSKYEIWIDKSTNLPYKVRREMSHNISVRICKDLKINQLNIENFKLSDYFPKHYQIVKYGSNRSKPKDNILTGKPAPNWALESTYDSIIDMTQLKSKVLLIQFTSVNCGPCRVSVEFIKNINNTYCKIDVDVIAIECTSKNINVLKTYSKKNNFDYKFLLSTKKVTNDYSINSFPVFFILDADRKVHKVIEGYSKGETDKEIVEIISKLI